MLFICSKTPPIRALTQEKSDVITVKKKKKKKSCDLRISPMILNTETKTSFSCYGLVFPTCWIYIFIFCCTSRFLGFSRSWHVCIVFLLWLQCSTAHHCKQDAPLRHWVSSLFRLIKCFDAAKYNKSTWQIMHLPYPIRENHSFKML